MSSTVDKKLTSSIRSVDLEEACWINENDVFATDNIYNIYDLVHNDKLTGQTELKRLNNSSMTILA